MKESILFIVPSLVGGGAKKTVSNLSYAMQEHYDVNVISIYGKKEDRDYDVGGNLICLEKTFSKNFFKRIKSFFEIRKIVKNIKEEKNIRYSISFLVKADIINVFSKTKNKEKTIVSIRNNESIEYKNNWFKRNQVRVATRLADKIVSISEEVKQDLIDNFNVKPDKIKTIYNPCIINIKNEEIDKSLFNSGKTVINVGNLKFQKGQWHLIKAFSKVVEKEKDAKLLILGRGQYKDYLERLIKEYGLQENVYCLGFVSNPYDYIEKADIFVFSSLFEGLGNALMETLFCGIPIISTDYSCGAREILAPDTDFRNKVKENIEYAKYGILIPVCDSNINSSEHEITKEEEIMAEAILKLINNKDMQNEYRNKSLERAKYFEINNIVNQWYGFFNEL